MLLNGGHPDNEVLGGGHASRRGSSGSLGSGHGDRSVYSKPTSRAMDQSNVPVARPIATFPSMRPKEGIVVRGGRTLSNANPFSKEFIATTNSDTPNLRKDLSNRIDMVAPYISSIKRRRRRCADLVVLDPSAKHDAAEKHYPSPISIQSATENVSPVIIQQPSILRQTIEAKAARAAEFALSAEDSTGFPSFNQPVTESAVTNLLLTDQTASQPAIEKDLRPWTLRSPVIPFNICESGHPLFVVTGTMWLDKMPIAGQH
ncbi:MAG: hypothetical protein Q9168_003845 [Polycauliona sp. 1 TL-2023]